jgi:hypothetical protein
MSEVRDPIGRLHLVGYEKLTGHGFALPVFGRSPGANLFYTARSTLPGEANGQIAEFNHYDPGALVCLPLEQIQEAGIGEPWLDVFLWEDRAYVGTARHIWDVLAEARGTIEEHAPLSLLALAEATGQAGTDQLALKVFSWLTTRYGMLKALEWQADTYFRGLLLKTLRRELGAAAYRADISRALQEELIVHENSGKLSFIIGSRFSFVDPARFDAIAGVAATFGVKAEFIIQQVDVMAPLEPTEGQDAVVRHRTSEDEMRIAALRVAASKPHGKATTTELKNEVDQHVALTAEDLLPSNTRPNEAMYQQIVGNLVSHRASRNNIFAKGWAIYTGDGIQITDAGRQHLKNLGLRS